MGKDDVGPENRARTDTIPQDGVESLNIAEIVRGLVQDLQDLRAARITVQEANARSKLAHEILRGINYVITAQKALVGGLQALPNPDADSEPKRKTRRSAKDEVIDL